MREAARLLQIEPLLDRKPTQLSGGQRQRVAIGRAIVRDPKVFLFDEPLSNLDAALRVQTRIEIAKLHRHDTATMIYVTHDQVEAMTLADRIVVLNAGRIEQVGTPLELYHRPANLFVAGFIGSPQMNFIACQVAGVGPNEVLVSLPGRRHLVACPSRPGRSSRLGEAVTLGIRPDHVRVGPGRARSPAGSSWWRNWAKTISSTSMPARAAVSPSASPAMRGTRWAQPSPSILRPRVLPPVPALGRGLAVSPGTAQPGPAIPRPDQSAA